MSPAASAQLPASLEAATEDQPAARAAFAAAFAAGPTHAYALVGPAGTGKRAAARAFAAELLAAVADDPEQARRRALADPSPHPDLAWLRPPGNQHLVDEVRERVIGAVSFRPFEGGRRLFVIEAADAMADESQNALLKTLEEPPPYVHLLLVSSEPTGLLETVRSRCQEIRFRPLPRPAVERRLGAELALAPESAATLAALADGDLGRARFLASERGRRLRELTVTCVRAARAGRTAERPWSGLIELASETGEQEGEAVEAAARARAEELGKGRDADRLRRDGAEAAKRAARRARTTALDVALGLVAVWFVDLIACAEGVPEQVRNRDQMDALEADARELDPVAARRTGELAMATRRHLRVNVNEELALDALFHRAAMAFGARPDVL